MENKKREIMVNQEDGKKERRGGFPVWEEREGARCLVIDFDHSSCVLKDAVRDRRNWTGKALFELSLLACGHRALTSWRESCLRLQNSARLVWQRRGNVETEASFLTRVQLGDPTSRHQLHDVSSTVASLSGRTDILAADRSPVKRFKLTNSWLLGLGG